MLHEKLFTPRKLPNHGLVATFQVLKRSSPPSHKIIQCIPSLLVTNKLCWENFPSYPICSGFSPLNGFMVEEDYTSVVDKMRLANGLLFGLPVVLDTDSEDFVVGDKVLLTYKGQNLATFTVESKWKPNKALEAKNCYGTTSIEHPAVQMISMERGKYYMGGKVEGLELPTRVFPCQSPEQVRAQLPTGVDVLAFQCRNPIHRAHYELFIRALEASNVSEGAVCLVRRLF